MSKSTRIDSEKQTVEAMIRLYCRELHRREDPLCADCRDLLQYARLRLGACKFGEDKPTCGKCPVHCYKPDMRQKITQVMRYSGPRMLRFHPVMAVRHLLHSLKKFNY